MVNGHKLKIAILVIVSMLFALTYTMANFSYYKAATINGYYKILNTEKLPQIFLNNTKKILVNSLSIDLIIFLLQEQSLGTLNKQSIALIKQLQAKLADLINLKELSNAIGDHKQNCNQDTLLRLAKSPQVPANILHDIVHHKDANFLTDFEVVLHQNVLPKDLNTIAKRTTNEALLMLIAGNNNITTQALQTIVKNANTITTLQAVLVNKTKISSQLLADLAAHPAANQQLLQEIIINFAANELVDAAIVSNSKATHIILTTLAKRTKQPALLQAIASKPISAVKTMVAIVKNSAANASVLQFIAEHKLIAKEIATALIANANTPSTALTIIAKDTSSRNLLQNLVEHQQADKACIAAALTNKQTNQQVLNKILQRKDQIVDASVLQQILVHPALNAKGLTMLAKHSATSAELCDKIVNHSQVSLASLAALAAKFSEPQLKQTIVQQQKKLHTIIKQQQQNLADMQHIMDTKTADPVLSNNTAAKVYFGVGLMDTTFATKHNYGRNIFATHSLGGEAYLGYYCNDHLFVEFGLQRGVTKGGERLLIIGELIAGSLIEGNDFLLYSKVKTQLPYLGFGLRIPVEFNPNIEIFGLLGLAELKYMAYYDLSGLRAIGQQMDPIDPPLRFEFVKKKMVKLFKLGIRYKFHNNWGIICSGSWFNTSNIEINGITTQATTQKLILNDTYTMALGLWYLF